jgi:hypothetical protein
VPTVKSGPHRVILTLGGTLLAFCGTYAWILLKKRWSETDRSDPGRMLAEEMAASVLASTRRFAPVAALQRVAERAERALRHAPERDEKESGGAGATQTAP